MTKEEFIQDYYCKVIYEINKNNMDLIVKTEAIGRKDCKVFQEEITTVNLEENTELWSYSSDNQIILIEEKLDSLKRAHLDVFAQMIPIDIYYPNDTNIDTTEMYK